MKMIASTFAILASTLAFASAATAAEPAVISGQPKITVNYTPICKDGNVKKYRDVFVKFVPAGVPDQLDAGGFNVNEIMLSSTPFWIDAATGSVHATDTFNSKNDIFLGAIKPYKCDKALTPWSDHYSETEVIPVSTELRIQGSYEGEICVRTNPAYAARKQRKYSIVLSDSKGALMLEGRQQTGRYDGNNSWWTCKPEITNQILYPQAVQPAQKEVSPTKL